MNTTSSRNRLMSHAEKAHDHRGGNASSTKKDSPEEAPSTRDHTTRGTPRTKKVIHNHALGGKKSNNYQQALVGLNTFFEKEQVHGRPKQSLVGCETTAHEDHNKTKPPHCHQSKDSSSTGLGSKLEGAKRILQSNILQSNIMIPNRHHSNDSGINISTSPPAAAPIRHGKSKSTHTREFERRAPHPLKAKPKPSPPNSGDSNMSMDLNHPPIPSTEDSLLHNPSLEEDARHRQRQNRHGGMRRNVTLDARPYHSCPQKPRALRRVATYDNHSKTHHGGTTNDSEAHKEHPAGTAGIIRKGGHFDTSSSDNCSAEGTMSQDDVEWAHFDSSEIFQVAPPEFGALSIDKKAGLILDPLMATSIANDIRNRHHLLEKLLVNTYEDKDFQKELSPSAIHEPESVVDGLVDNAGLLQEIQTAATIATRERAGHLGDHHPKSKRRIRNNRNGAPGEAAGCPASMSLKKLYN